MQNPTPSTRRKTHSPPADIIVLPRLSVGVFLALLVLFIVALPFLQELRYGPLIQNLLLTFVLASGVLVIGASRRTLVLAAVLAVPAIAGRWINHFRPDLMPASIFLIAGGLFFVFLITHLLRFALRAKRVSIDVLWAGMATWLVIGFLWALLYLLVARLVPNAFDFSGKVDPDHLIDNFEAVYFSFVTLSTMGYGDILPAARPARMLAILEAMTGVFFVSVFISRLVALYTTEAALEGQSDMGESSPRPPSESTGRR